MFRNSSSQNNYWFRDLSGRGLFYMYDAGVQKVQIATGGNATYFGIGAGNVGVGLSDPAHKFQCTGGIVETGGVLKSNLLTNSAFSVWSNSTLEDVTGTNLATAATWTNYASRLETFAASGADITSAIETGGGTAYPRSNVALGLTVGKLYKIVATLTLTSGDAPSLRIASGGDIASVDFPATDLVAGANTVVFEFQTAGNDYLWMYTTGNTNYACTFVVTEVTPGITAATSSSLAFDGWKKDSDAGSGLDIYREHNHATYSKDGSFYSLKVVKGNAATEKVFWPGGTYGNAELIQRFAGRTVTMGCWVYSVSAADNVRLGFSDGSWHYSSTFAAADTWTWLEYTYTISASATSFLAAIVFDGDAADVAYISQVCLVFGSAIGSGNYSRPSGEVVWCETPIESNLLHNKTFSDVGATILNLEADTNGKFPKGAKGLTAGCILRDSGSAAEVYDSRVGIGGQSTNIKSWFTCAGITNDSQTGATATVGLDSNGDMYYRIGASGSDTLDIVGFNYTGVELR